MNAFEIMRQEFGSLYRMAKLLGVTPNVVYCWQVNNRVPAKYVKAIETLSEKRIACTFLRPDIFGE